MKQLLKQIIEKRIAKALKTRPQVRKTFPPDEALRALARSVMKRQLHPIILLPEDFILDGECRYRGMMLENPEFDVICVDNELSASEIGELQLISAMHSTTLSSYDQAVAIRDWLRSSGAPAKELAAKLDLDASMVSRLNSLWKTNPSVIEAAEQGKIGPKAWNQISLLPEADQDGLLHMHLSGMSSAKIAEESRKKRQAVAAPAAPKLSRCRHPLSTGTVVTVTGPDMALEDYIEALASALEQARKAKKDSLDIKTAEKVWCDRAKAGA